MQQKFDRAHLAAWRQSGQTQQAYCAANSISASTLAYWLSRERQAVAPARLVEVATKPRDWLTVSFGTAGFHIAIHFDLSF